MSIRIYKNYFFIGLTIVFLMIYFGFVQHEDATQTDQIGGSNFAVGVQNLARTYFQPEVRIGGKTTPNRAVILRAQTHGVIADKIVNKGQYVEEDDLIITIGEDDRFVRKEAILASIKNSKTMFLSAAKKKRTNTQDELDQTRAANELQQLQRTLAAIELDIERTKIYSPFDGMISDSFVEVGDVVKSGDPLFEVLDLWPIKLEGYLSQKQIVGLQIGDTATINLVTGESLQGTLITLALQANPQTRLYTIELSATPPSGQLIRSGISGEIILQKPKISAFKIPSSAIMFLKNQTEKNKNLAMMVLDNNQIARSIPIKILNAREDYFLVQPFLSNMIQATDLLIVQGQGYIQQGQTVKGYTMVAPTNIAK